tara:strand:+ start:2002 stop:2988 length:987 start_codon:yes stop_codon:yes gene_type:complete
MKVNFFTSQPWAPCSQFYESALKRLDYINFYDTQFQNYDILLLLTYDHQIIKTVKEKLPKLKIGIIDPRSSLVREGVEHSDFIIIDSTEMEDFWRVSRKPIFRYSEYPDIEYYDKQHTQKNKVTIGYHGNKIHLECMAQNVTEALSNLGKKHDLELLIMHNFPPPDGTESWYPDNVSVRHVPWSMSNYHLELSKADIGIAPNNIIHDESLKSILQANSKFNCNVDDYSIRFKMPSNPGRILIFGKLGIPVVADFYPSAMELLAKERNGFVAHSSAAWEYYLDKLVSSHELRTTMGNNLQNLVRTEFDFDVQNSRITSFFESLLGEARI